VVSGELVSVCLLTYNHVNLVESTISSILDQSIDRCEVIVSDDCSSDGTWELLGKLASADDRIQVIRTPTNLGMAGNANFAVGHATKAYVALLHHDDLYRHDLLEKWVAVLERHPTASFVFNPYAVYNSNFIYDEKLTRELIPGTWLLQRFLFPRWGCLIRGTAMVRRSAWQELGGMRVEFGLLADVDLWMRLARLWDVGYVAEPLITVRQDRPSYYPSIYSGTEWSWRRQRVLYEIHSQNRLEFLNRRSVNGRAAWWWFRARLAFDTTKWLLYAMVRRKNEMLRTSHDGMTRYHPAPVEWLRRLLVRIGRWTQANEPH